MRKVLNKKVRLAMVGCGDQANYVHYPSFASFEDVELAAVCDLLDDRLTATADKYHIEKRYKDYQKMVEDVDPDAVCVIGQPDVMYPLWRWCLEHKLNLFIEKPMGITIHQARNLAYLAAKHGCITQVGFQRRNCPILVRLRDECVKRGPVTHALVRFYKRNIVPHLDARDHMMDDGVHSIDTLRWLCGGEVVHLESCCRRVGVPDINFISATMHFSTGATGFMINSWSSGRRIFDVEVHSPNVCAEVELEGKGYLYADGDTKGVEFDTRQVAGSDKIWAYGGFAFKDREFIDCLKAGKQPSSHFADAVKTMEIADKILAQAILGGK
ncbi:MAG: Gfo/Idh/MocA family protein [Phycisphaerae bacterium]